MDTKVSLLISTYNWEDALRLCLLSASIQTVSPDEIVIADDGSREDTRKLIDDFRVVLKVPIVHIWQEDKGFRNIGIAGKNSLCYCRKTVTQAVLDPCGIKA